MTRFKRSKRNMAAENNATTNIRSRLAQTSRHGVNVVGRGPPSLMHLLWLVGPREYDTVW